MRKYSTISKAAAAVIFSSSVFIGCGSGIVGSIADGLSTVTGTASDGLIQGADVSYGGQSTTTNVNGVYSFSFATLPDANSSVTVTGGIDTTTGELFEGTLTAYVEDPSTVAKVAVTPITTLIEKSVVNGDGNYTTAKQNIATKLGIDPDVVDQDPFTSTTMSDDNKTVMIQKALEIQKAVEIFAKAADSSNVNAASESIFKEIAKSLENNNSLDIALSVDNIKEAFSDSTIQNKIVDVNATVNAMRSIIQDMNSSSLTTDAGIEASAKAIEVIGSEIEKALVDNNASAASETAVAMMMMGGVDKIAKQITTTVEDTTKTGTVTVSDITTALSTTLTNYKNVAKTLLDSNITIKNLSDANITADTNLTATLNTMATNLGKTIDINGSIDAANTARLNFDINTTEASNIVDPQTRIELEKKKEDSISLSNITFGSDTLTVLDGKFNKNIAVKKRKIENDTADENSSYNLEFDIANALTNFASLEDGDDLNITVGFEIVLDNNMTVNYSVQNLNLTRTHGDTNTSEYDGDYNLTSTNVSTNLVVGSSNNNLDVIAQQPGNVLHLDGTEVVIPVNTILTAAGKSTSIGIYDYNLIISGVSSVVASKPSYKVSNTLSPLVALKTSYGDLVHKITGKIDMGNTDYDVAKDDYASLNLSSNTSSDLDLTLNNSRGSSVEWVSSDLTIMNDNGTLVGTVLDRLNARDVNMTAMITKGDQNLTKVFSITVDAETNTSIVAYAKEKLIFTDMNLTSNLTLDTNMSTTDGRLIANISWDSNDSTILTDMGEINATVMDRAVTLDANITRGTAHDIKTFNFIVKASDEKIAEASISNVFENFNSDYFSTTDANATSSNLDLNTTGLYGSTISWESNNTLVMQNNGSIVEAFRVSPANIELNATAMKGDQNASKLFNIIVLPSSNQDLVNNVSSNLVINNNIMDTKSDIVLPTNFIVNNTNIADINWTSNNIAMTNEGNITRGLTDINVTLTANYLSHIGIENNATGSKDFNLTIKADPSKIVAKSLEDINASFIASYNLSDINSSIMALELNTTSQYGETITWDTNDTSIFTIAPDDSNATINNRSYMSKMATLTVTSTSTIDGDTNSTSIDYPITISPYTNTELVTMAKTALQVANHDNNESIDISSNLALTAYNPNYDVNITWSSSNDTNATFMDDTNTTINRTDVKRSDVNLTAYIFRNDANMSKDFNISILASDDFIIRNDYTELNTSMAAMSDYNSTLGDLNLSAIGNITDGTNIAWSSTTSSVLNGVLSVTKAATDSTITVTADINRTGTDIAYTQDYNITLKADVDMLMVSQYKAGYDSIYNALNITANDINASGYVSIDLNTTYATWTGSNATIATTTDAQNVSYIATFISNDYNETSTYNYTIPADTKRAVRFADSNITGSATGNLVNGSTRDFSVTLTDGYGNVQADQAVEFTAVSGDINSTVTTNSNGVATATFTGTAVAAASVTATYNSVPLTQNFNVVTDPFAGYDTKLYTNNLSTTSSNSPNVTNSVTTYLAAGSLPTDFTIGFNASSANDDQGSSQNFYITVGGATITVLPNGKYNGSEFSIKANGNIQTYTYNKDTVAHVVSF